jgi:uncharacterized protein YbbC (DUF1343 family)
VLGAPWIHERELSEFVNRSNPPGVRVVPLRFIPTSSKFQGEECRGLHFVITDWNKFRPYELGLIVAKALRTLYRDDWQTEHYMRLLGNEEVYRRVLAGEEVATILSHVDEQVKQFRKRRKPFLLYE